MFSIICYCTAAVIHRLAVQQHLFFLLHVLRTCLSLIDRTIAVEIYSGILWALQFSTTSVALFCLIIVELRLEL